VSIDVVQVARQMEDLADELSGLVQDADEATPFGDAGPPELLAMLGSLTVAMRYGAMLSAQVCDAVTAIAVAALSGE
jgi:hypothetical protein